MKTNVCYIIIVVLVIIVAVGAIFWIRSAQQGTNMQATHEEELYLDRDLERAIESADYE